MIRYIFPLSFLCILLLLSACRPENRTFRMQDDRVWFESITVESVDYSSAFLSGTCLHGKDALPEGLSFQVSTVSDFTAEVITIPAISVNKEDSDAKYALSLSANFTGLQTKKQYFLRAFALTKQDTQYSPISSFLTTDFVPPSIETGTPDEIGYENARVHGNILSLNGLPLDAFGFLLNEGEQIPVINQADVSYTLPQPPQQTGAVSHSFQGLKFNQVYTCVFYAQNEKGIRYGNSVVFLTQPYPVAQVETGTLSDLRTNACKIVSNRITENGATILSRHVLVSTSNTPDESNSTVFTGTVQSGNSALFDANIVLFLPATTYYYRARIQTPAGLVYGQIKAFTTPAN
jgi:hypothetical protein